MVIMLHAKPTVCGKLTHIGSINILYRKGKHIQLRYRKCVYDYEF